MKKFLLLASTALSFVFLGPEPATAGPLIAPVLGIVGALVSGTGLVQAVLGLAVAVGSTLLNMALAPKEKEPNFGVKLQVQVGDDQPVSTCIGLYATTGKRKYIGSYGDIGGTPNAMLVDVLELGSIPTSGPPLGLWIDDKKCTILWDQETSRGFPIEEFKDDDDFYAWIRFHDGNQTQADSYLTTDDKLYRYTGSTWTASVAAGDMTGQLISSQIADAAITAQKLASQAIDATKFAAGIEPVTVVTGTLPTVKSTNNIVFQGKTYTWNPSTNAYETPSFSLADNSVTAQKLADAAVIASKLAQGAVTHDKISAGSIYGDLIAAKSITAKQLILTDWENFIPDSQFEQGTPADIWDSNYPISNGGSGVGPASSWLWNGNVQTGKQVLVMENGSYGGSASVSMWIQTKDFIPVTTGDWLAWDVSTSTNEGNPVAGLYYRIHWFGWNKAPLSSPQYTDVVNNAPATTLGLDLSLIHI